MKTFAPLNRLISRRHSRLAIFLFLILVLGCDTGKGGSQDEITKQLGGLVNEVWKNSDVPMEELKKLHQLEYKLTTLPLDTSPAGVEAALNEMGKNRWDCFHVEKHTRIKAKEKREAVLTFVCKRPLETPLRYVPRTLIGR